MKLHLKPLLKLHRFLMVGLLAGCGLNAGVMTLDVGGPLTASPGATTGWRFTLTWTSADEWASVTGSALINETNPLLGTFTDFIGPQGGPDLFAVDPSSSWTETFDGTSSLGLGSYTIDPAAAPLAMDSGQIVVYFDVYDGPPATTGNYVQSEQVTANFTVQAVDSVPEPASLWMAAIGAAFMMALRRRGI